MGVDASNQKSILFDDVTFGYNPSKPIFKNLSMDFPFAAVIALRASNGAGKSTLVELSSGYLQPQEGKITICGMDASSPSARKARRVVRTKPSLYPTMSVFDHLAFTSKLVGSDLDQVLERVNKYHLEEWLDTKANELSTGTERKLWLIMCTLGKFAVVIFDEPFIALDDAARGVLLSEIDSWRSDGRLVVVATHEQPQDLHTDDEYHLDSLSMTDKMSW